MSENKLNENILNENNNYFGYRTNDIGNAENSNTESINAEFISAEPGNAENSSVENSPVDNDGVKTAEQSAKEPEMSGVYSNASCHEMPPSSVGVISRMWVKRPA